LGGHRGLEEGFEGEYVNIHFQVLVMRLGWGVFIVLERYRASQRISAAGVAHAATALASDF